jgi:hypothetical protein
MKQLIIKLLLVVVLSAFSPIVAAVPTATPGVHALQQTHQIAGRFCQPWPSCYHP